MRGREQAPGRVAVAPVGHGPEARHGAGDVARLADRRDAGAVDGADRVVGREHDANAGTQSEPVAQLGTQGQDGGFAPDDGRQGSDVHLDRAQKAGRIAGPVGLAIEVLGGVRRVGRHLAGQAMDEEVVRGREPAGPGVALGLPLPEPDDLGEHQVGRHPAAGQAERLERGIRLDPGGLFAGADVADHDRVADRVAVPIEGDEAAGRGRRRDAADALRELAVGEHLVERLEGGSPPILGILLDPTLAHPALDGPIGDRQPMPGLVEDRRPHALEPEVDDAGVHRHSGSASWAVQGGFVRARRRPRFARPAIPVSSK